MGVYPKEVFIHARTKFNWTEWNAFKEVTPEGTNLVGISITDSKPLKLYKSEGDFPILRGCAYVVNDTSAFLWTLGYVPKIQTSLSMEVPNPIYVEINKGQASILQVLKDILALTKLNYNACIYADGLPVTLRFADKIGEILTASMDVKAPPLAFKYYI
jgi:argonaute-like protein implicated in RNA metabolism and viral defense